MITLNAGAATSIGRIRSANEDASLVLPHIMAVADGMGGHASGEIASALAIETLKTIPDHPHLHDLVALTLTANTAIIEQAEHNPQYLGMGTTLCCIAVLGSPKNNQLGIVNVGDSRLYCWNDSALTQITEDHTFVEGLVREGRLSKSQAEVHPQRNVLTRALGVEPELEVDSWTLLGNDGDRLLVCSDGLYNEVSESDMGAILGSGSTPEETAQALIAAALEGGGRDNITCIVVDVSVDTMTDTSLTNRLRRSNAPTPLPSSAPPTRRAVARKQRTGSIGRTLLFVLALAAIAGLALGGVGWYARSTYYVQAIDNEVAIYQGPPQGVLWIEPIVSRQNLRVSQLASEAQKNELISGKEFGSYAEAQRYVDSLSLIVLATTTTTTTSTTTTTIGIFPPVVPLPTSVVGP